MNPEKEIVVVPDVHGRTFWKDVYGVTDCDVVFLGDYLDPYPDEGISNEDAIENFNEIIELAKNRKNVRLLYGNHDLGYAMGTWVCDCRHDYANHHDIRGLFLKNKGLFSIAYEKTVNGKRFLLTHAGVLKMWVSDNAWLFGNVSYEDMLSAGNLNKMFSEGKLDRSIADMHWCRGGDCDAGSPVWADLREWDGSSKAEGVVQIVGHNMLVLDEPLVLAERYGMCCMDARTCSYIDSDGDVRMLADGKFVEEYKIERNYSI